MSNMIEANGLTKTYPPGNNAVDHVYFTVDGGEIFGFLGPNGAGKTTTIKLWRSLQRGIRKSDGSHENGGLFYGRTRMGEHQFRGCTE